MPINFNDSYACCLLGENQVGVGLFNGNLYEWLSNLWCFFSQIDEVPATSTEASPPQQNSLPVAAGSGDTAITTVHGQQSAAAVPTHSQAATTNQSPAYSTQAPLPPSHSVINVDDSTPYARGTPIKCSYGRTCLEKPARYGMKMWSLKMLVFFWWQVWLDWNVGLSARTVRSFTTGGLSWQWSCKTGFTVLQFLKFSWNSDQVVKHLVLSLEYSEALKLMCVFAGNAYLTCICSLAIAWIQCIYSLDAQTSTFCLMMLVWSPKSGTIFITLPVLLYETSPHSCYAFMTVFAEARKLFDSTKDDLLNMSADHDEDKYKRRPALQWFSRWFQ